MPRVTQGTDYRRIPPVQEGPECARGSFTEEQIVTIVRESERPPDTYLLICLLLTIEESQCSLRSGRAAQ